MSQHLPIGGKINIPYKNKKSEEFHRTRNGIILDTLTSVDIVEIVKCGGIILEFYERFFCHDQKNNTFTEFVTDIFEKKEIYLNHRKGFASKPSKKDRIVSLWW